MGGEAGGKKLEKLGIDISAATLESEGLLANLQKLEGLDVKAIEQIFGQEAIQVMSPVLNNLEKFEQLLFNQKNAAAVAAKAHEIANDTIQAKWTRISNIMSNMFADQTALGEALKITLDGLGNALLKIINLFENLGKGVAWVVTQIKNLHTEIKALTMDMPDWLKNVTGLGTAFESGDAYKESLELEKQKTKKIKEAAEEVVKINKELDKQPPKLDPIVTETDKIKEQWKSIGETIKSDVTSSIKDAIKGSKTLGQSMSNILSSIADKAMDVALNMALWGSTGSGGMLGGLFSGIFGKANGGPVSRKTPYMVGERGPEIFVPHSSGKVIPNNRIGGGTTVNVNVNATESNVSASGGEAKQLGLAIASAVQQQLVKERRPGGLLSA